MLVKNLRRLFIGTIPTFIVINAQVIDWDSSYFYRYKRTNSNNPHKGEL